MLEYIKVRSENLLPPINLNSFALILSIIVAFKYILNAILKRYYSYQIPDSPKT